MNIIRRDKVIGMPDSGLAGSAYGEGGSSGDMLSWKVPAVLLLMAVLTFVTVIVPDGLIRTEAETADITLRHTMCPSRSRGLGQYDFLLCV
jgi:hypothetical protein